MWEFRYDLKTKKFQPARSPKWGLASETMLFDKRDKPRDVQRNMTVGSPPVSPIRDPHDNCQGPHV